MRPNPATLDAAILYDKQFGAPMYGQLLNKINLRVADFGATLVQTNASGPGFVTFRTDDFYILISFVNEPLAPEGFRSVLASGHTKNFGIDFDRIVAGHKSHIFITCGDGQTHMIGALADAMKSLGMQTAAPPVEIEVKVLALHAAVSAIMELVRPDPAAVHWCQSNTIYTPETFPKITDDHRFPVGLVTHPQLYEVGQAPGGETIVGGSLVFSEQFCGKTLCVERSTHNPYLVVAVMLDVLYRHIMEDLPLEEGHTGRIDQGYGYWFHHHPPTERYPHGAVELVVATIEELDERLIAAGGTIPTAETEPSAPSDGEPVPPSPTRSARAKDAVRGEASAGDFPFVTFEAAVLYDTPFRVPAIDELYNEISARLARLSYSVAKKDMPGETVFSFGNDTLYVEVSFQRKQADLEGFKPALSSRYNYVRHPQFIDLINDHVEHVEITVGDGPMPLEPFSKKFMQENGLLGPIAAADPRIKASVLHGVVEAVLEIVMPTPTLVHWRHTELLHKPDDFPHLTERVMFPVPLAAHPEFFGMGQSAEGQSGGGILMRGSELFLGRTLFAEPTSYDLNSVLMSLQLVMLRHIIGVQPVEDGTIEPMDKRAQSRLEFRPPSEMTPAGGIAMIVEPLGTAPPPKRKQKAATGGAKKSWWPFGKKPTLH